MEKARVINIMRIMNAGVLLDLEHYHRVFGGKYYRGRPQMLLLRMSNGRNVQLFRRGTIQILGAISEPEAQAMRQEIVQKLGLLEATPLQISNLVVTAQLKMSQCSTLIAASNGDVFHEIELFPATLIHKWHPAHIALFHNGKIIITGVKSLESCRSLLTSVSQYLSSQ